MTATSQELEAEVDRLAGRLRLPYLRRAAAEVIPTGRSQRWDPGEVLRAVLAEKAAGRDAAGLANRRRRAGFPTGKTFDSWDTDASSVPTATEQALRSLEWIRRAENLAVIGPSGTGKSHLLKALGHAAVDDGLTVTWFNIQDLGQLVHRHRVDDSVDKAIQRVIRADLIVIDDIGLLPVPDEAAEALLSRHRRRLRTPLGRSQQQRSPRRLRRAVAGHAGHRRRRPVHAPRPPRRHRRRLLPLRPSPPRQGGDTPDLTHPR
jgi:DNA replication protein DnaC